MSTATAFDLARFTRAVQERDASTQLSMYAPHATVTIVDKISQPGSPRVLRGSEQVRAWLEDTFGRDMTHEVGRTVQDERGAAYTLACRYPDGTNVLCVTVLGVADGLIEEQTVAQVWDEA